MEDNSNQPVIIEVQEHKEDGLLQTLVQVLTRRRRLIFWSTLLSAVVSVTAALLITPMFRSVSTVFPAEKSDILSGFQSIPSLARSISPTKGLLRTDPDLEKYSAILRSGRVVGEVINRFDLVRVYEITKYPIENATKELLSNVEITIESEGYLSIAVYDKDPVRAANMANFFLDALNRTNIELQSQNARATRLFLEERHKKNLIDLAAAEDSLTRFQKTFGVIDMPEQTKASIKVGADFAAQLALKEVQLGVLERTLSPDHPNLIGTKIEIDELRRRITQLNGSGSTRKGEMQMLVPFGRIPSLGVEYVRRFREVEIQSKILQFITPLFEQAKVEEKRETPSIIILDKAYPAERKSRPKRMLIVLGGVFVGLFGSICFAGINYRWQQQRFENTSLYRAEQEFVDALRFDLRQAAAFLTRRR